MQDEIHRERVTDVGSGNTQWELQHEPRFDALSRAIKPLPDCQTILDVGIEPYQLAEHLLTDLPSTVDYQGIALGDAGNTWTKDVGAHRIRVASCNAENDRWPYDTESIGCVVMGAILEHLFDPLSALQEARRVLRPGGVLVLSTPNATRLIQRFRLLTGQNVYDGYAHDANPYHRHNHEWTRREVVDILGCARFHLDRYEAVTLRRDHSSRLGGAFEMLTSLNPRWRDQHVIRATRTDAKHLDCSNEQPIVYQASLTEREN